MTTSGISDREQYAGVIGAARTVLGNALTGEHERRIRAAGRQAEYGATYSRPRPSAEDIAEIGCRAAEAELAAIVAEVRPISGGAPVEAETKQVATLTLTIAGTHYRVRKLTPEDPSVVACYSVRKRGAEESYHVSQHRTGLVCTCADWEFKRNGKDPKGCKHIRAIVAVGLLSYTQAETAAASGGALSEYGPFPRKVRRMEGLPTDQYRPEPAGDFQWASGGHEA